ILDALMAQVWSKAPLTPRLAAIRRVEQQVLVSRLIELAALDQAMPQVRAEATAALRRIQLRANEPLRTADSAQLAHQMAIRDDIERFLKRPDSTFKPVVPLSTPPGDPIGGRGSVR